MENCPIAFVILNLLVVYNSTIQYKSIAIIVYASKCHRTIPHYIMSYNSIVNKML